MPVLVRPAIAKSNASMRQQLQYQNTPEGAMSCRSCLEFLAGNSEQQAGRCKLIPDDDEIAPNGYCIKWNTM